MDIHVVTLFLHNLRDYARERHRVTDDYAYGGGPGMVMKPEPFFEAVAAALAPYPEEVRTQVPVVLLTPQGRTFTQRVAQEYARRPALVLLCGHYEGVDERVREHLATDELSIGDYVLTGGELAAMVVVDAVVRLLPGALGHEASAADDSFTTGLLQGPLYTRPPEYRGWRVPEVLLSGNHQEVARWRRQQALLRTLRRRPDLLLTAPLTEDDRAFLRHHGWRPPPEAENPN